MYILVFLLVLSILILVHEYGHYKMAKALGVRVERFSLGFGPKLVSRVRGETEFAVGVIPLGGYVKMAGEDKSQCTGARNEFYSRPPGHRGLIILMGPLVNYLLGFFCFWLVFSVGYPALAPKVGDVIEGYPAQDADMRPGDIILTIGGQAVTNWEDIQKYVTESKTQVVQLTIQRGDRILSKEIIPAVDRLENIFGQKEEVRIIGIQPEKEIRLLKYSPGTAFFKSGERIGEITYLTYKALWRMATGAMSARKAVTGPIGIFYIIKDATDLGFSYVVYVLAIISVSLAIFNLLPLPILDGGHLLFLLIEKMRGQPVSDKVDDIVNRVGFALIIFIALFVFYTDFMRYGLFDKILEYWQKMGS